MDVANTLRGLAILEIDPNIELMKEMSMRIKTILDELNPQDIASMWSIAIQASRNGDSLYFSEINSQCKSIDRLQMLSSELATNLIGRAVITFRCCDPVEISSFVWSLGN